jgi:RAB protein geranylgeranyltransferase component A
MVNLLVSSNISRYAEFKAITRILTLIDDNLVEVPVSRGDIFNCKDVSVIEKRMLMKFMMFCSEYDKHHDQYKGFY